MGSNNVLWPEHLRKHGNTSCTLILDNCPSHRLLDKDGFRGANGIPDKIIVLSIPPYVTCRYQLMVMGIIACFKVGYCVQFLEYFLKLFDIRKGMKILQPVKWEQIMVVKALALAGSQLCYVLWNWVLIYGTKITSTYAYERTIHNCWL